MSNEGSRKDLRGKIVALNPNVFISNLQRIGELRLRERFGENKYG